jgi:hypothetical protein
MEFLSTLAKWLSTFAFWVLTFIAPAREAMIAVAVLVVVDLFVGVWAAKKRGEAIVSWKLRHTVTRKIFPYQVAIICALYIENNFFSGLPIMKAIAGFIAISEAKSLFERLGEITGLDFWSVIRERLQPTTKPRRRPPDA